MAYQVIARKWRPQTFDEVTGQEPITRTLRNAIEHRRLHHAYLFSGARGVGKTTSARLLAKALNCHKSTEPTPTPCRSDDPTACASCREITESRSIDVQEIDAASNTGVDNVRDAIIASVGIAPARDRYKIFIIDEVHMLSGAAFNALLKTLEEPPPRVVFIMATTERHKVPETILSRCQQFEFRTIATAKILERLKLIAKAENISIPDDALREIARTGEGSMRDAQSALDQVISFAGTKIKKEDVEMALGVAGADVLTRIIDSIAENKPAVAIGVVDDIVMRGHDLRNFCRDLLAHFRDLLVTKVSGQEELLESAVCDLPELKRQAALFTESDLVRFFHSLSETETKLRAATQPRYQLEVGIVKLMELRGVESISEILQRLQALESGSISVSSNPTPAPAVKPTPAPALKKAEPETPLESVKKKLKPMLATALESAQVTWNAEELFIEFAPESRYLFNTLSDPKNTKFLADACREVTGQETRLRIELKELRAESGAAAQDDEKQRLREMAESSPVVQQALKTFRGEIVDVRPSKTNRRDPN
ncbi:MAG TPA: DNA polymerase III subunit gamma/tau [Pyrinomonadaceae bacterium]|nr:DNA polymerase III subunit gamma/tau [Pyrinomonadaceae bacterium]